MNTLFANIAASLKAAVSKFRRNETGATAVEYGIMVSLIAVVIILAVSALGGTLQETFVEIQCSISGGTLVPSTATAGATCTP